jgi:hypothetical protein
MASVATSGTLWPEATRTVLQQVNEQLGGRWLLVECKEFNEKHPLAGQPARALLHVHFWAKQQIQDPPAGPDAAAPASNAAPTDNSQAVSSITAVRQQRQAARDRAKQSATERTVVTVMKTPTPWQDLAEGVTQIMFLSVYELSKDGWPTGDCQGLHKLRSTLLTWIQLCQIPCLQTLLSQCGFCHTATAKQCDPTGPTCHARHAVTHKN